MNAFKSLVESSSKIGDKFKQELSAFYQGKVSRGHRCFAFDEEWYLWFYDDVAREVKAGEYENAFSHYLGKGISELRNPNPVFDEYWYRETYPVAREAIEQELYRCGAEYYVAKGANKKHHASPIFDPVWYREHYPEVVSEITDSSLKSEYDHFLFRGIRRGYLPGAAFSEEKYFLLYPDAKQAVLDKQYASGFAHYAWNGIKKGYRVPYHKRLYVEPHSIEHPQREDFCFDEDWYVGFYSDVRAGIAAGKFSDGFTHYLAVGISQRRSPNPVFDERWYRNTYRDVREAIELGFIVNAAEHYVRCGSKEGRHASSLFDPATYLGLYPEAGEAVSKGLAASAYQYFLDTGLGAGHVPSKRFDDNLYLESNQSARDSLLKGEFSSGYEHLLRRGLQDGCVLPFLRNLPVSPYPTALDRPEQVLFDSDWYLTFYPDVFKEIEVGDCVDAFDHYCKRGIFEMRNPNPVFDECWYREAYPNVAKAIAAEQIVCGAEHYLRVGCQEGRLASRWFNSSWYLSEYPEVSTAVYKGQVANAYEHFLRIGLKEGLCPSRVFRDDLYFAKNKRACEEFVNGQYGGAFPHYIERGILSACSYPLKLSDLNEEELLRRESALFSSEHSLRDFLSSDKTLDLELSETPLVSILIVTRDAPETLFTCLNSICEHVSEPYEVIVIDNDASRTTTELLERVNGARIVANGYNEHYLRAANLAASCANGEYLLFLHDDSKLAAGAVTKALALFEEEEGIGVVGAKLISPQGLVEEYGRGFFSDALIHSFAHGLSPSHPSCMKRQDTFAVSNAFLFTTRDLFMQAHGFDEYFAPAYYEDSDYCFRIREMGKRVVLHPSIVCTHFKERSVFSASATPVLQERNRVLFRSRHCKQLVDCASSLAEITKELAIAPPLEGVRKKVLYLDDRVPFRYLGSGFPRSFDVVQALSELGYEVTVLPTLQEEVSWHEVAAHFPADVEVYHRRGINTFKEYYRNSLESFDCIWLSRFKNIERFKTFFSEMKRREDTLVVYDAEAISSDRDRYPRAFRASRSRECDSIF